MKGAKKLQKVLKDFSGKQWQTEGEGCMQREEGTEVAPLRITEV